MSEDSIATESDLQSDRETRKKESSGTLTQNIETKGSIKRQGTQAGKRGSKKVVPFDGSKEFESASSLNIKSEANNGDRFFNSKAILGTRRQMTLGTGKEKLFLEVPKSQQHNSSSEISSPLTPNRVTSTRGHKTGSQSIMRFNMSHIKSLSRSTTMHQPNARKFDIGEEEEDLMMMCQGQEEINSTYGYAPTNMSDLFGGSGKNNNRLAINARKTSLLTPSKSIPTPTIYVEPSPANHQDVKNMNIDPNSSKLGLLEEGKEVEGDVSSQRGEMGHPGSAQRIFKSESADEEEDDFRSVVSAEVKSPEQKAKDEEGNMIYDEDKLPDRLRATYKPTFFIIFFDDPIKQLFDILVMLLVVYTATVSPYRIAFYDEDSIGWLVIDGIVDGLFAIDMILTFFTAYFDNDENIVLDRKSIAKNYIKGWFFVDLIAITPINVILQSGRDYTSLARIARLPRLYRLIKMAKLVRMLKIAKERGKFNRNINEALKLSVTFERLVFFVLMFFLLSHVTACLWYFLAKLEGFPPDSWVVKHSYMDSPNFDVYIASFYYIITTITTVGYGDITPGTTTERIFSMIIMIIGVVSYSFAIGSFSNIISNVDSREAKLKEKIHILNDIKHEYHLTTDLYMRLRKALKYDHTKNQTDKFTFLNELPPSLKIKLSYEMHNNIIATFPFFQGKPPQFIAFIGPLLRPMRVLAGEYVYMNGDPIDDVYFLINGQVGLVLPDFDDTVYVKIDKGYYFGEVDFLHDRDGRRAFTVKALTECELLSLSRSDLDLVCNEFSEIMSILFTNSELRLKRSLQLQTEAMEYCVKHENNIFQAHTTKAIESIPINPVAPPIITLPKCADLKNIDELEDEESLYNEEISKSEEEDPGGFPKKKDSSASLGKFNKIQKDSKLYDISTTDMGGESPSIVLKKDQSLYKKEESKRAETDSDIEDSYEDSSDASSHQGKVIKVNKKEMGEKSSSVKWDKVKNFIGKRKTSILSSFKYNKTLVDGGEKDLKQKKKKKKKKAKAKMEKLHNQMSELLSKMQSQTTPTGGQSPETHNNNNNIITARPEFNFMEIISKVVSEQVNAQINLTGEESASPRKLNNYNFKSYLGNLPEPARENSMKAPNPKRFPGRAQSHIYNIAPKFSGGNYTGPRVSEASTPTNLNEGIIPRVSMSSKIVYKGDLEVSGEHSENEDAVNLFSKTAIVPPVAYNPMSQEVVGRVPVIGWGENREDQSKHMEVTHVHEENKDENLGGSEIHHIENLGDVGNMEYNKNNQSEYDKENDEDTDSIVITLE